MSGNEGGLLAEQFPLLLRAVLALAAVLLLAVAAGWAARRFGGGYARSLRRPGRVQVIASHLLDGRTRVVLVRRDDREHLLAVGAGGVTLIESFEAQSPPVAGGPAGEDGTC